MTDLDRGSGLVVGGGTAERLHLGRNPVEPRWVAVFHIACCLLNNLLDIDRCHALCPPPITRLHPWCRSEGSKGCQDGSVGEADNAAEWAKVMMSRYDLVEMDNFTAEAEAMTVEERAEFQVVFEKLAYLEAMLGRGVTTGNDQPTTAGPPTEQMNGVPPPPSGGT